MSLDDDLQPMGWKFVVGVFVLFITGVLLMRYIPRAESFEHTRPLQEVQQPIDR